MNRNKRLDKASLLLDKVVEQLKRSSHYNAASKTAAIKNANDVDNKKETDEKIQIKTKKDAVNDNLLNNPEVVEREESDVSNRSYIKSKHVRNESHTPINEEDEIKNYLLTLRNTRHHLNSNPDGSETIVNKKHFLSEESSNSFISELKGITKVTNTKKDDFLKTQERSIPEQNLNAHSRVNSVLSKASLLQDKYIKSKEKFKSPLPSSDGDSISSEISEEKKYESSSSHGRQILSYHSKGESLQSNEKLDENDSFSSLQQVFSVNDLLSIPLDNEASLNRDDINEVNEQEIAFKSDDENDGIAKSISSNIISEEKSISKDITLTGKSSITEISHESGKSFFENVRLNLSLSQESFEESLEEKEESFEESLSSVEELNKSESLSQNDSEHQQSHPSVSLVSDHSRIDKTNSWQKECTVGSYYSSHDASYKSIAIQTSILESKQTTNQDLNQFKLNLSTDSIVFQPQYHQTITEMLIKQGKIEALSSYSPGILALHELMRQQMYLTKQFHESQKQIYSSQISSLVPDYHYTSWNETQQYIKNHASRYIQGRKK